MLNPEFNNKKGNKGNNGHNHGPLPWQPDWSDVPLIDWQTLNKPSDIQRMLFNADPLCSLDVCLYQGGMAAGKTHNAVLLGLKLVNNPNSIGMVVAKRWSHLRDTIIPMYLRILRQQGLSQGRDYRYNQRDRSLWFSNHSVILFRPVNAVSQAWKGVSCGWIHADDVSDLTLEQFDALLMQLNHPEMDQRRFFGTTRPVTDHWLNTQFGPGSPQQEGFRRIIGKTTDNPTLDPMYLRLLERRLPVESHRALLDGRSPLDPDENPVHLTIVEHCGIPPFSEVDLRYIPDVLKPWYLRQAVNRQKRLGLDFLPCAYYRIYSMCDHIPRRSRLKPPKPQQPSPIGASAKDDPATRSVIPLRPPNASYPDLHSPRLPLDD